MPFDFPTLLNVLISGLMTGLVYGLMALGLSVIFGVARVVNFAHGEMMALAMYAAALLFSKFRVNPLMAVVPVGAAFFFFGYGLQRLVLRPFVIRPQHSQFLLLLALAVVITSILLIVFGPDARAVNLDWLLEPVVIGDLLLDQGKHFAARQNRWSGCRSTLCHRLRYRCILCRCGRVHDDFACRCDAGLWPRLHP